LVHYCFFEYLAKFTSDKQVSDIELAALLNVSVDTIKKIEKAALTKMREHKSFSELKGDEPIVPDRDGDFRIYR
jgi:DNA-directed RNA polymerase sigma subunit (sigma70/sigma32)